VNVRLVIAILGAVVAGLITSAATLAMNFELTGFGRPRDVTPRIAYLLPLAGVVVASVLGSWWAFRWAGVRRAWIGFAVAAGAVVLVASLLGLG